MVNPAITAALIAATQQDEVEQKIEAKLKKAGAVASAKAIALELGEKDRELLDQALAGGTVKQTSDGRYYLHERSVAERNEGQGFMALLIILAVGSLIASAAVLLGRAGG